MTKILSNLITEGQNLKKHRQTNKNKIITFGLLLRKTKPLDPGCTLFWPSKLYLVFAEREKLNGNANEL